MLVQRCAGFDFVQRYDFVFLFDFPMCRLAHVPNWKECTVIRLQFPNLCWYQIRQYKFYQIAALIGHVPDQLDGNTQCDIRTFLGRNVGIGNAKPIHLQLCGKCKYRSTWSQIVTISTPFCVPAHVSALCVRSVHFVCLARSVPKLRSL